VGTEEEEEWEGAGKRERVEKYRMKKEIVSGVIAHDIISLAMFFIIFFSPQYLLFFCFTC
jgi:hypothetical protein